MAEEPEPTPSEIIPTGEQIVIILMQLSEGQRAILDAIEEIRNQARPIETVSLGDGEITEPIVPSGLDPVTVEVEPETTSAPYDDGEDRRERKRKRGLRRSRSA